MSRTIELPDSIRRQCKVTNTRENIARQVTLEFDLTEVSVGRLLEDATRHWTVLEQRGLRERIKELDTGQVISCNPATYGETVRDPKVVAQRSIAQMTDEELDEMMTRELERRARIAKAAAVLPEDAPEPESESDSDAKSARKRGGRAA